MKVLVYSSKKLYDNSGYEGRAEADLVCYRTADGNYQTTKNKTSTFLHTYSYYHLQLRIRMTERDEFLKESMAGENHK
tara:strand:+ start:2461 stop:2694 length:234 start_codon:yes stop_codon:yes gene_type:complete